MKFNFQDNFSNWWLRYLNGPHWWLVNIGSDDGLVLSSNKPKPEPMLTHFMSPYCVNRPQWVTHCGLEVPWGDIITTISSRVQWLTPLSANHTQILGPNLVIKTSISIHNADYKLKTLSLLSYLDSILMSNYLSLTKCHHPELLMRFWEISCHFQF